MTNESERAKFEAWCAGKAHLYLPLSTTHSEDGDGYWSEHTDTLWTGWLARAKSSGPVVAVSELEALADNWEADAMKKDHHHQASLFIRAVTLSIRTLIAKHMGME